MFVTIEDESNMSVDFLKRLNAQDRTDPEWLCTVPIIIRRSPSQVFLFVFSWIYLSQFAVERHNNECKLCRIDTIVILIN